MKSFKRGDLKFWSIQLVEMPLTQVRGSNYQLPTRGCMLRAPGVQKEAERAKKRLENGQADGVTPIPLFLKKAADAKISGSQNAPNWERENATSISRGQPLQWSQHTGLKTARLQQGQNRAHFNSELGEAIRGVFRARNPIHILELPFLQELLNAQKMTR